MCVSRANGGWTAIACKDNGAWWCVLIHIEQASLIIEIRVSVGPSMCAALCVPDIYVVAEYFMQYFIYC